jgi:hypothetical protein
MLANRITKSKYFGYLSSVEGQSITEIYIEILNLGDQKSRAMSVPAAIRVGYKFGLRNMALDALVGEAEGPVDDCPAGAAPVVLLGVWCPFRPGDPVLAAPELEPPVTEERVV